MAGTTPQAPGLLRHVMNSLYKKVVKSNTCFVPVNLVKYETRTKQKSPAVNCPKVIL